MILLSIQVKIKLTFPLSNSSISTKLFKIILAIRSTKYLLEKELCAEDTGAWDTFIYTILFILLRKEFHLYQPYFHETNRNMLEDHLPANVALGVPILNHNFGILPDNEV